MKIFHVEYGTNNITDVEEAALVWVHTRPDKTQFVSDERHHDSRCSENCQSFEGYASVDDGQSPG